MFYPVNMKQTFISSGILGFLTSSIVLNQCNSDAQWLQQTSLIVLELGSKWGTVSFLSQEVDNLNYAINSQSSSMH